MSDTYILYGASGHGRVIQDIVDANGKKVALFIDDNPNLTTFGQIEVQRSATVSDLAVRMPDAKWIISIGNNATRKKIAEMLTGCVIGTAIHPTVILSAQVAIGAGTVMMPGAVINAGCIIGKHVIVNTNATIDHDCVISDYVHVAPGSVLCGNVHVGAGTHIGAGATVIQGIRIGSGVTVGAGAVIIKDVPDGVTVVGNPGRYI